MDKTEARIIEQLEAEARVREAREKEMQVKLDMPQEARYIYPKRARARCESCGYRIRGPNHEKGDHHNGRKPVRF